MSGLRSDSAQAAVDATSATTATRCVSRWRMAPPIREKAAHESLAIDDGIRRCQRLPEVTHPVDSARPDLNHIKSRARRQAQNMADFRRSSAGRRPEPETAG